MDIEVIQGSLDGLEVVEFEHNNEKYHIPKDLYLKNIEAGNKHILVMNNEVFMVDDDRMLELIEVEKKLRDDK